MREIKFRAWLQDEEVMLYSENDVDDSLMEVWRIGSEGCKIEVQEEIWREGGGEIYNEIRYVEANAEIMQYTGLKDKNGKEIFEGDIVRTDFKQDGSHESIQVVEFYEGAFGSRNKDDHFRIPALFSSRATEGMNTNYYEVIGNIHKNPELISK